jgi:hypothetical protein
LLAQATLPDYRSHHTNEDYLSRDQLADVLDREGIKRDALTEREAAMAKVPAKTTKGPPAHRACAHRCNPAHFDVLPD